MVITKWASAKLPIPIIHAPPTDFKSVRLEYFPAV